MRHLTFALFIVFCYSSYGQVNQYQNLIDTALIGHGALFIHSKPIKDIQLDPKEMWNYFYFHRDYANKVLDTVIFAQIIQNAQSADTTLWQDRELKNFVLISDRDESVSKKYAVQKLGLNDKRQARFLKKQIKHFNSTDSYHRDLYYFSRPVFDNSKQFAVIQWDNGHSGLGGGGGIVLYQLKGDTWKELGIVWNWKY